VTRLSEHGPCQVVDFFFLMCYCFVNVVCVLQTLLRAPNWRPRFKFYHWALSLLGAALCLFIMFATYWYYAVVVCALCAAIYEYVEFKGCVLCSVPVSTRFIQLVTV